MSSKPPSLVALLSGIVVGLIGGIVAGAVGMVVVSIAAVVAGGTASWQGTAMVVVFAICVLIGVALPILNHMGESTRYQEGLAAQERARKEGERSMQLAEVQRASDLQMSYKNELDSLNRSAVNAFDAAQRSTESASAWLAKAKEEYSAGIYSFFWEAIEHTAKCLGAFAEYAQQIESNADRYAQVADFYEGSVPPFSIARTKLNSLKSAEVVSRDMDKVVRTALSRKDYTDIYEQRRTSSILISGFTSMEQAIKRMSDHVSSAIGSLSSSMSSLADISNAQLRQSVQSTQFASMDHREAMRQRDTQHKELTKKLDDGFQNSWIPPGNS